MNKKTIIIILLAITLLLSGGVYLYYSKQGVAPVSEGVGKIISIFFPSSENREPGNQITDSGESFPYQLQNAGSLVQLTKNAVSGAGAVSESGTFGSSTVRYVEKTTGHIYQVQASGADNKRISNYTILKTFDTDWSVSGDKLLIRYFSDDDGSTYHGVKIFSASIDEQNATSTLSGIFLPATAVDAVVSPVDDKIFYLNIGSQATDGVISDFKNKKQTNIFDIPFGEFKADWQAKDFITLLTKPSFGIEGYFYSLDAKTGVLQRILGGIKGLTALMSPLGDKVIYNESSEGVFETKVLSVKDKTAKNLGLMTLPEKCAWAGFQSDIIYCAAPDNMPDAKYPDDWYQGLVSFNDSIWKINLATDEIEAIVSNTDIDAIDFFLTKDRNYLLFINKKDGSLWSLKLN